MTDMSRLGIDFAGVHFNNPIIPASGTFGYGREFEEFYPLSELGGISVKGTTGQRRTGNLPPRIAETPSGMLNSVGLQNPGIDHFIAEELPYLKTKDTVVIANIAGSTAEEYAEIARKLDSTDDRGQHLLPQRKGRRSCFRRFLRRCGSYHKDRKTGNFKACYDEAFSQCHKHCRHRQGMRG